MQWAEGRRKGHPGGNRCCRQRYTNPIPTFKEYYLPVVPILHKVNLLLSGIDVKDVSLVINYDMAKSIEMYTHR